MKGVVEILEGYRKSIDENIMDFVGCVLRNMGNLDLDEVKLRCDYISHQIDKFRTVLQRASSVVKELKEAEGGKEKEAI